MGKNRETGSNTVDVNGDVSPQRPRRGSRIAFSLALTALMLGTFVSFGGFGYAATQARNSLHTLTKVAAARKVVVHHSSAADQYNKKTKPGKKQIFQPPKKNTTGTPVQAGTLPFTGLSLAGTALLSGLLLLVGIVLRRRERRSS
jgi:hypothetical protein